jgi:hypothetical protein
MSFLKHILPFILIVNFISCFNCPKPFTSYKQKINVSNIKLKTEGIFVSANGHGSFYLYTNGKVWRNLRPASVDFWKNPKEVLQDEKEMLRSNIKEWWGDFFIKEDSTIIIQTFGDCSQCFCRRMVLEETGKIINDSSFIIYSTYGYDTKDTIEKSTNIFNFYPSSIKSDSTIGWFVHKKWYKNNLDETRK